MDICKNLYKHENVIMNYYNNNYGKISNKQLLDNIYKYVKCITKYYCSYNEISNYYKFVRGDILYIERKLSGNEKILNVKARFDDLNVDNFIEYIVYQTIKYLLQCESLTRFDLCKLNVANKCDDASTYVKKICENYHVKSYVLSIYPGYKKTARLFNGSGYHFANVVKYENKYYLIDLTYSQFFGSIRNNLERLGLLQMSGCDVGRFMMMSDQDVNIATNLIRNGYIELNDDILKRYLDAFTISFRNGLYYENTLDFSYKCCYTIDDYVKFLKGIDNQINHEQEGNLGFQKKPLKNALLDFKRRNK